MTPRKPTAMFLIEPTGLRGDVPREHLVKVTIPLSHLAPQYADKAIVLKLLEEILPPDISADPWRYHEATANRKPTAKTGTTTSVVVGVEASVVSQGRPEDDAVARVREALLANGYSVDLSERRECAEASCMVTAVVGWNQPLARPAGWYDSRVCGAHNYRDCARCKSVYVLTSSNAAGQNPSVHCVVCGAVMIEWGSSKVWSAVLVTRGVPPVQRDAES